MVIAVVIVGPTKLCAFVNGLDGHIVCRTYVSTITLTIKSAIQKQNMEYSVPWQKRISTIKSLKQKYMYLGGNGTHKFRP